ncbi:MAG: MBL fold metallo-hydrolase [Flavobacteriales bacterium]|nr:MBL fold metallo-hydrolase [Flavobacteriales bacterium]
MKVEQIYTSCLSQGAYFIESNGEAAVIDPLREVSNYIKIAEESNSKIKYVFETHFHADFVSGHLTLSNKTGADIVYGPKADPEFKSIIAEDNQTFKIGKVTITAIHTPGHTLESTSYLLKDEDGKEYCIFTGDTLFLGDVGIPDVAQRYMGVSKEELAGILYVSVNNKIKPLPDDILVYPGHGAGSACGKNMMKQTVDTLANQKNVNYALNGSFTKEGFIKELTDDLPEPPNYFPSNVKLNQKGYLDFDKVLEKSFVSLELENFKSLSLENNTTILDVRNQNDFRTGFVPNSIFIGLNGGFAPWVGSVLKDINTKILLVCDNGQEQEAIMRLSRVGFDNCLGFLNGGFKTWKDSGSSMGTIDSISASGLEAVIDQDGEILDVRQLGERNNGRLKKSAHIPLGLIDLKNDHLNKLNKYYIHCAGGYRSMIACSVLKKQGFKNLIDVDGGFESITNSTSLEIISS